MSEDVPPPLPPNPPVSSESQHLQEPSTSPMLSRDSNTPSPFWSDGDDEVRSLLSLSLSLSLLCLSVWLSLSISLLRIFSFLFFSFSVSSLSFTTAHLTLSLSLSLSLSSTNRIYQLFPATLRSRPTSAVE